MLLPLQLEGRWTGAQAVGPEPDRVEITLIEAVDPPEPVPPVRDPRSDRRPPGLETPTVEVAATDRPLHDTPALDRRDEHTSAPEPEPVPQRTEAKVVFVRADPQTPLVSAPDTERVADRNLRAEVETRRELATPRIGPPSPGDPSATDLAGANLAPDTVSMPRVELADNDVPLQRNLEDHARPGARSGGAAMRSRAEAPEAPEIGAPGGHDQQRVASKGAQALEADGHREPGEAGDDAPTRDGLALASEGDFPVPSTGGADPGDPKEEGPDLPSRADKGVRPLLTPGFLDWIAENDAADGGQPRTELGDGDEPSPRAGELSDGDGQTHAGEGTGIAEANPGERQRQRGSRAAAGGTGSALTDTATVAGEEIPLDVEVALNAVETPLGRYAASIDQLLREGWRPPLEAQVMSGYGVTTVEFRVDRKGRVTAPALTRMSGVPGLDDAALAAVPTRVPRPAREVLAGDDVLTVSYTFRHSSPIVSRSAHR